MIKFFRKIRQNLLMEGKTSSYLKYAFGEIILVVIGILIALQINNWNTNVQQKKIEIKYLTEIKENLKKDLSDIDYNISFTKSKLQSNKVVLQYLNGAIEYTDSIEFHLSNIFFSVRTVANMSAYENLKSRGLELISNDALRQQITILYEYKFYNAIDFESKDVHEFQYQILLPEVTKALNITAFGSNKNNINGSAEPIDKDLLRNNHSFKNAITLSYTLREIILETYEELKENIQACITQIEQELKKYN